jgi:hypothetical protein
VIAFHDEKAVRWTVVPESSPQPGQPGHATLVFTNDAGERRTCDCSLPPGGAWEEVEARVWCALLRHAEVVPPRH